MERIPVGTWAFVLPAELPGNRQQEFQIESVPKRGPSWDGPIRIRRRRWVTADLEPAVGDAALK